MADALRIGTRGSALALAQAQQVADALSGAGHPASLVTITTSGDRGASVADDPAGIKGLFVTEIVRALQNGTVDLAVHSAKDLPSTDPAGVRVMAVPRRATPTDVLVARAAGVEPGPGVRVGTSSLRRRAQMLAYRPGVEMVDLRGNVDTRLRKLEDGEVDAIVVAAAGLERLGLAPEHMTLLQDVLPAPGQGALAVQMRSDDERRYDVIDALDHEDSHAAFLAERRLMEVLGGGCALPLAGYAKVEAGDVHLQAAVFEPDGSRVVAAANASDSPHEVASLVADELRAGGAAEILARLLP